MEIKIIEEAGHRAAVTGMKFSHQQECFLDDIQEVTYVDTSSTRVLSGKDKGHNKFLESIMVWVDIRGPLYFWKQFDTYRIGVTKQSKSTMHTLMRGDVDWDMFTDDVYFGSIEVVHDFVKEGNFYKAIANMPDGYLQTRRVCLSYKTIRTIILQRRGHKLSEWKELCDFFCNNLKYPKLLGYDIQ